MKKRNEVAYWNKKERASGKVNSFQKRNSYKEYVKQATLFNQPKPKPTPQVLTEEAKALKIELANMGFQIEFIDSALEKTKTF